MRTRRYRSMMRTVGRAHRAARREVARNGLNGKPVPTSALNRAYIATAIQFLHTEYTHVRLPAAGKRVGDYMNKRRPDRLATK